MLQNVATYGGLCALATFDRSQLQKQVIGSQSFKLFLELDPLLREVIDCGNCSVCFTKLVPGFAESLIV